MTTVPKATILNCTTGEVIERPLTAEEIEAQELAKIQRLEFEAKMKADADEKAEIKASALAKLAALGLTEAEANTIIK